MKFYKYLIEQKITKDDLNRLESWADSLFSVLDIDIEFTRHFLDRVNDIRNKRQIEFSELRQLFKDTYIKYGKKISSLGDDAQAVIKDMRSDINMPFVLNWDKKSQEFDLVAKTVMRKKNFKTSNKQFILR